MASQPENIGRFRVLSRVGRGGMGVVYLAEDPLLKRKVAIKVLRAGGLGEEEQTLRRFRREAEISARLNHPNVVTVHDVGEDPSEGPFLAMEYVDGDSLARLVRRGELGVVDRMRILVEVFLALQAAHDNAIVHRDVKPQNVMVGSDGRAKLMDFGIALGDDFSATRSTDILGTPAYLDPAVLAGDDPSASSDRYAFAVLAFEVLSGKLPFAGDSMTKVLMSVVNEPPDLGGLGAGLKAVFSKALAKKPDERFPDLRSFVRALLHASELSRTRKLQLRTLFDDDVEASGSMPSEELRRPTDVATTPPTVRTPPPPPPRDTVPPRGATPPQGSPPRSDGVAPWAMALAGLGAVALVAVGLFVFLGSPPGPDEIAGLAATPERRERPTAPPRPTASRPTASRPTVARPTEPPRPTLEPRRDPTPQRALPPPTAVPTRARVGVIPPTPRPEPTARPEPTVRSRPTPRPIPTQVPTAAPTAEPTPEPTALVVEAPANRPRGLEDEAYFSDAVERVEEAEARDAFARRGDDERSRPLPKIDDLVDLIETRMKEKDRAAIADCERQCDLERRCASEAREPAVENLRERDCLAHCGGAVDFERPRDTRCLESCDQRHPSAPDFCRCSCAGS